ncbi:MAG: sigma 54-interacting transcriptional regulator [Candidatus Omnitrophica bacterium]|nr:sigma 54-interacting transcriptional regulator [bacterium]MBV6480554.1 Psp operon transcriptional activator [bacterium]MBW7938017.1 sigma 54-interacting transcriptional regulator [Candidatus Omnitrophota bacterium]
MAETGRTPSATPPPRIEAIGRSEAFRTFQGLLSRAARVNRPVLIIGERGTGKELAAARLHALSPRWQAPLVALNCAALPPTLIESELFGHEEGAFTGAGKKRQGRFELAHGGTLFLDEVARIPLETQVKILRVVEYGSFERVGGSRQVQVEVRIIGATNADLPEQARKGNFLQDLLDRLSFEVLFIPPLRERREDILLLTNYFASRMALELGLEEVPDFSDEAEQVLLSHPWPGNVRELKNVVERAIYQAHSATIDRIVLDPFEAPFDICYERDPFSREVEAEPSTMPPPGSLFEGKSYSEAEAEFEVGILLAALERARYNQRQAADLLKMSYHQFRWLYRKHRKAIEAQVPPQGHE